MDVYLKSKELSHQILALFRDICKNVETFNLILFACAQDRCTELCVQSFCHVGLKCTQDCFSIPLTSSPEEFLLNTICSHTPLINLTCYHSYCFCLWGRTVQILQRLQHLWEFFPIFKKGYLSICACSLVRLVWCSNKHTGEMCRSLF